MSGDDTRTKGAVFRGIGVSPGVAAGPVALLHNTDTPDTPERTISDEEVAGEIARLEEAVIETRRQIRHIQETLSSQTRAQDASILDAHLMVLDDRTFLEEVIGGVKDKHQNVEFAVRQGTDRYASVLEAVEDDYLRERVVDVRDVGRRLLRNLTGVPSETPSVLAAGHLIVAHDLAPSETASLPKDRILGFATDIGSPTSHTAVMARALELPAVVGLRDISQRVKSGDYVLIDGNKGVFIVNPTRGATQNLWQTGSGAS
jgi:phosphotransferase system enzyme I (PtsI)